MSDRQLYLAGCRFFVMSWFSNFLKRGNADGKSDVDIDERMGSSYLMWGFGIRSARNISPESARAIATAYRAANIISDDIAKMPLQMFERSSQVVGEQTIHYVERIPPNPEERNTSYLLEISPNSFGWTPFIFKKALVNWLLFYGNAYIWSPPVFPPQKFVLPADRVTPVLDMSGSLWYEVVFPDASSEYLPAVEVLHVLINPDRTGFAGRGVLEYARDTMSMQLAAYATESGMMERGMNPSMIIKMAGDLGKRERDVVRQAYQETMGGSDNAGGVAVFDRKVLEFKQIEMKLVDMQFLESIKANDQDIANFFGMPLHMLNMGKEAYSSNEQKYLEYLSGTLDAYLVQIEQAARIKWLPESMQANRYFKFNRAALLRMDAKARAETNEIKIRSATMSPNEARFFDDMSGYPGGERYYMTLNYAPINTATTPPDEVTNDNE